jgi:DedD protein
MALFKTRKGGDEPVAAPRPAESIEALRRRARHRLIGAAVLVLIGVVAFPVLFDTQPRPIPVDIPIDIPDRNKVPPLAVPAPATHAQSAAGPVAAAPAPSSAPAAAASPAVARAVASTSAPAVQAPAVKPSEPAATVAQAQPRPEAKPQSRPEPQPKAVAAKAEAARANDGTKAQALLDGKQASAAEGRFVVQVGSFSDAAKAREARLKVEHAGLKTYTQAAETANGKRIRVRVGPFGTRAEADRAAGKIKGLDLPAAILSL